MTEAAPQDHPAWEKMTDLPVGEILRRARVHYNLSLDDVAATLHIRAGQLGALEENRPELLPGRVYAIGFVRAYAEYLGLDGDKMVHLFKAQSIGQRAARPELSLPAAASESKSPGAWILATAAIMLGSLLMGMIVFGKSHRTRPVTIPAVSHRVAGDVPMLASDPPLAMALQGAMGAQKTEVPSTAPPPAPSRITIEAADSVWLEIRDAKGKPLISRVLKDGDTYDVPDQPGLKMDTGNAGALEFIIDDEDVPAIGANGDVLRNFPLDSATVKNPPPPPPAEPDKKAAGKKKR